MRTLSVRRIWWKSIRSGVMQGKLNIQTSLLLALIRTLANATLSNGVHSKDVQAIEIGNTVSIPWVSSLTRKLKGTVWRVCIVDIDFYVMEIVNKVSSLIRTPKLQYQVCILQRCLCYRGEKYGKLFNRDDKRDSRKCAHSRYVYAVEIGNTVTSLIRTPKGQYQVCTLQKCLCYRDRKYS